MLAQVDEQSLSIWLHRFRPGDPMHPFQELELFN
ncbi:hypothetical protein DFAR_800006 [Desulfarculales bacterium]